MLTVIPTLRCWRHSWHWNPPALTVIPTLRCWTQLALESASVNCHSDIKMLDTVGIGIRLCDCHSDTTLWVVGTFCCPRLLYECHTSMVCYTRVTFCCPRLLYECHTSMVCYTRVTFCCPDCCTNVIRPWSATPE